MTDWTPPPCAPHADDLFDRPVDGLERLCRHCPIVVACARIALEVDAMPRGRVSGLWAGRWIPDGKAGAAAARRAILLDELRAIVDGEAVAA